MAPRLSFQPKRWYSFIAEDNLSDQARGALLLSITGERHKDTQTKQTVVGWREIKFREVSASGPLTKPWKVGPFGICDANTSGVPAGQLPWNSGALPGARARTAGRGRCTPIAV